MTSSVHTLLAAAALCTAHALQPARAATPALRCEPLAPTLARTLQPGALLLLGEIHGTAQSPAMAEQFVCTALQRQRRVALFLEIPADEQPRIDAYLQSDGGLAAQRALVSGSPFRDAPAEGQDGRRSVAMLGLIEAARRLRQSGAPLNLIAFDATQGFAERDRAMADRVRAERAHYPARVLITYSGNVHNMLELPPGIPAPMGTYLVDLRPVSLNLLPVAGGAAWSCSRPCGVHSMPPMPPSPQRKMRQELRRFYTDVVPLGPVTPSIPAVARLAARAAM